MTTQPVLWLQRPTQILIVLLLTRILSGQCGNVTLTRFSLRNENEDISCYLIKSVLKAKLFQTMFQVFEVHELSNISKECLLGEVRNHCPIICCIPMGQDT